MKDLIEIIDINGKRRKVEIVTTFNLEGYDYNYIIYKELDGSHTYLAKYKGNKIEQLDTNLSEQEIKLSNIIYEGVKLWV